MSEGERSALGRLSEDLVALVDRVMPSVVALSGLGQDFDASGSGFLIDDDGHVVTNFHVVDGLATPLDVALHGGGRQKGRVLGSDPLTDLAVLRLEQPPGQHLNLREAPARLGELCLGLGSPFGIYPESVAMGVVSGVARTIPQRGGRPIEHAIQTDVAINPGNSGGPLVDVDGQVIGMNQCIDSRAENIGFAIPAETVRWVSRELIESGIVVRAALGVSVVKRPVQVEGKDVVGLAVTRIRAEAKDGLQVNDVILRIDGQVVDETSDLYGILTKERIGVPTAVEVLRGDAVQALTLTPVKLEGPPKG